MSDIWDGLSSIKNAILMTFKGNRGNIADGLFEVADSIRYVGTVIDLELQNRRRNNSEKEEKERK